MPELPEVETIARALRMGGRGAPSILGMEISGMRLNWPRTLASALPPDQLNERLKGQVLRKIGRRGKLLHLSLDTDHLLFHLRMSGDLRVEALELPLQPHDRLTLEFSGGYRLAFNDTRKFGRLWVVSDPQEVLVGLGPEPLEETFTPEVLGEILRIHKRQLKPLLLDQTALAGLGNIYADEALHRAGLHPLRLSHSLTDAEVEGLWEAIRQVLQEGIERQGASIDWVYRGGDFQNYFRVYQRAGEPCPVCGTPIERIVVGQRGTHFCPNCQR